MCSGAMAFVSLHHGHTRGAPCFSLAPKPLGATPTTCVARAIPVPRPNFCALGPGATRSLFVAAYHVGPLIASPGFPPSS